MKNCYSPSRAPLAFATLVLGAASSLTAQSTATGLDRAVAALYSPASPTFHKWLTDAALQQYAPTPEQVAAVRNEFQSHGLAVTATDSFTLRATGTAAGAQAAFGTAIHQFSRAGKVFQAATTAARLSGPAAQYVSSVSGLQSHAVQPMWKRAYNLRTGKPYAPVSLSQVNALGGLSGLQTDIALTPLMEPASRREKPLRTLPLGIYRQFLRLVQARVAFFQSVAAAVANSKLKARCRRE